MAELTKHESDSLVGQAREYRERAYAPYSKFLVGAALLTEAGSVFGGCNVENASYGLTICAERNAIATAIANGERAFRGIAIVTSNESFASPCGACRQFMVEFSPNMRVILANAAGEQRSYAAKDLLPEFFSFPD
jgi:cytidine deaminase